MAKKILIIDDNQADRDQVKSLLSETGYEITECDNGIDGLEMLRKELPDLIILDYEMPELSGLEFLRKVQELGVIYKSPIIFNTSVYSREIRDESYKLGVTLFLNKPLHKESFVDCVDKLTSGKS